MSEVLSKFTEDPRRSIRGVVKLDGMPSVGSIHRILKGAKFHPFKMQIRHKLRPQDCLRRVHHARAQLALMENNPDFLGNLVFSDEAHFHVHGGVNTQNCRYWSNENPHWFDDEPLHSPRVTVWAAIGCNVVIGPVFIEGNVTGVSYLSLLQQHLLPAMQPRDDFHSLIFMQDGAPPHWSLAVRNWLTATFPERWMGRGSPNLPWPPYSPDLTPMDFFLWGWVKSQVYRTPVTDVEELRKRIRDVFGEMPHEMVKKSVAAYRRRLHRCIAVHGKSVEQSYVN